MRYLLLSRLFCGGAGFPETEMVCLFCFRDLFFFYHPSKMFCGFVLGFFSLLDISMGDFFLGFFILGIFTG